jgi:diacylglycerol kinase family enzyme
VIDASVAVLLNMNASRSGPAVLEALRRILPETDIYASRTAAEADQAVDAVLARQYSLVFCGGGDGTAMHVMNRVYHTLRARTAAGAPARVPAFGFLKLGGGNGWATQMNTPAGVAALQAARQTAAADLRFSRCNLLDCDGEIFDRGGMGLDALNLNSYVALNERFAGGPLAPAFRGFAGYWAALFGKTLPHMISQGLRTRVRVTNLSDQPVLRVNDACEAVVTDIGKGQTMYEGPAIWVGFGTICVGGYGFIMFPHAQKKRGHMSLRILDVSIPRALRNVRSMYNGSYRDKDLQEFLARDALVEFERDTPFHLNGDAKGYRRAVRVKVSDFEPDILDFRRPAGAGVDGAEPGPNIAP